MTCARSSLLVCVQLFSCLGGTRALHSRSVSSTGTTWAKIYQIQDGPESSYAFPLTTGAYGNITSSEIGSSHAKYSDSDINAMASARDGYTHVYQIKSSDCASYLYVRSSDSYVDTSASFGLTKDDTQVCLSSAYESCSTWATLRSTLHGIDLLYTSPNLGGETCCRYFFGHGAVDCYAGPSGHRCVKGGSQCQYKKLDQVAFYIWTATPSPTPSPTPEPTSSPTPSPAPEPTSSPSPSPTPGPTSSPTSASAMGDPHITSITGAKFDIVRPGNHTLLHIPRFSTQGDNLIDVRGFVKHEGSTCLDMYIDCLHITGKWVVERQLGVLSFFSGKRTELSENWLTFGVLKLKVVHGSTSGGTKYLNLFAKDLSKVHFSIGGILGLDDHSQAATREEECKRAISLLVNMSANDP
ncbi:unnamed protein product [Prorocentrum cordatum]|uniref:Uncharacterized protein n=1 Tax=Prorocentrum cordatum TaxID=2364126 RepID=A0ABN9T925_9DINO|nr:unnamed protein product [Polarella glacialis]